MPKYKRKKKFGLLILDIHFIADLKGPSDIRRLKTVQVTQPLSDLANEQYFNIHVNSH